MDGLFDVRGPGVAPELLESKAGRLDVEAAEDGRGLSILGRNVGLGNSPLCGCGVLVDSDCRLEVLADVESDRRRASGLSLSWGEDCNRIMRN